MEVTVGTLKPPWKLARSVFTLSCRTLAKGERRECRITAPNRESVRASKLGQGERDGKKDFINLKEARRREETEHESGESNRKQIRDDS